MILHFAGPLKTLALRCDSLVWQLGGVNQAGRDGRYGNIQATKYPWRTNA